MCRNSLHSYVDLPTALSFQGNRNVIELYKTYILKARERDRQTERGRDYSMQLSARDVRAPVTNAITVNEALPRPFRNYSGRNC
jgi:hypothetical protein